MKMNDYKTLKEIMDEQDIKEVHYAEGISTPYFLTEHGSFTVCNDNGYGMTEEEIKEHENDPAIGYRLGNELYRINLMNWAVR